MSPSAAMPWEEARGDPLLMNAIKPPEEPPPGLVVGLVTECIPGVDRAMLLGHREELDQIQRSTSAQLVSKEDLNGGYTVIVTGTRPVVEHAFPRVQQILQGPRPEDAPPAQDVDATPALSQERADEEVQPKPPPWRSSASSRKSVESERFAIEEHLDVAPGTIGAAVIEADTPHDDNPIPIGPSSFLTSAIFAAAKSVGSPHAPELAGAPPGLAIDAEASSAPDREPEAEVTADAVPGGKKKKRTKAKRVQQDHMLLDAGSLAEADDTDAARATNFVFPKPVAVEGVKIRKKVIFRMRNVTFAYPGSRAPAIVDANIEMSQASRIVVTGAKGAGKSTVVKVLIGKLKLSEGAIQKAVGLSVAYVSQHMFHQLEERMHLTPLQYMLWRFAAGGDQENPELQCPRARALTQTDIEQHFDDFGVDAESVNRLHIKQLNRSMRFRLVLAAAMWSAPNLLILDEPASCLDRDSLEALASAIEDYKGGVLITSHSKDVHYFESIACEKYFIRGGRLRADCVPAGREERAEGPAPMDRAPTTSRPQAREGAGGQQHGKELQCLTAKEAKELFKDVERRLKDGRKNKSLTDEDMWKMLNELNELKERLET